eukprot:Gregarina_sp_Poly_1__6479@NODE_346_length_9378_cov_211_258941_g289_i0_p1_GENE_NODE_346_length_9378_cov_211_258941_g289_i0NODE_346_length_9378_cov_211_258941_g289_i0_p1_ORF_typecomplete_len1204_score189_19PPDK_N/PF01326_19/3_9e43CBM_20/PF00686_19/1_2e17_NODE_346_length_9378_cov_211_258941_g289_i033876998
MEVPSPVAVFECHCAETKLGESVVVTGSIQELGNWQVHTSTAMITSVKEFPLWRSRIFQLESVQPGDDIEFKFFIQRQNNAPQSSIRWETCANRRFRCPKPGQLARVVARFGNDSNVAVNITEISSANVFDGAAINEDDVEEDSHNPSIDVKSPPKRVGLVHPEETAPSNCFGNNLGDKSCSFNRSDEVCQLFSENAEVAGEAAAWVASLSRNHESLRQKCAALRDLMITTETAWRGSEVSRSKCWRHTVPTLQMLAVFAYSSILLSWVSSSVVKCGEDGGHHRPNQVALLAKDLVNICEKWKYLNAVARLTTTEHIWEADLMDFFARQIEPCLPSFKASFTCSVPLTRIRDIAHRNDISQDLKREIKTTLQNKLHRCAGPEDLVKSKELLDRFRLNPENYSPDFLREFETFHSELIEFFNADGLEDRLSKLLKAHPESNSWRVNAINRFVANKFTFEADKRNSQCLHILIKSATHLREALLNEIFNCGFHAIESQDDALQVPFFSQDPSHGQSLRLAEIQTEAFLFTLYSRFINDIDGDVVPRFDSLAPAKQLRWLLLCLSLLCDALKNLVLSGFAAQYACLLIKEIRPVLESEIPPLMDRVFLLHVASLFRRALRLVQCQADLLSALLPPHFVQGFANNLFLDESLGKIYTEGQIRASLAFQIARLCSAVLAAVEIKALKKSPFQVICAGAPSGQVVFCKNLDSCQMPSLRLGTEVILVCLHIDGDEELDGLSERLSSADGNLVCVCGLISLQDVPALSHIGVRARQLKLPFISVSLLAPPTDLECLRAEWEGAWARMDVESVERRLPLIRVARVTSPSPSPAVLIKKSSLVLHPMKAAAFEVLMGADVEVASCGAKAAACQELFSTLQGARPRNGEKSCTSGVRFQAPRCVALPFGAMDAALQWPQNQAGATELRTLLGEINTLGPGPELARALARFRRVLQTAVHLPPEAARQLSQALLSWVLPPESLRLPGVEVAHVMVRSSSNCEDLQTISGAGLYESVLAAITWEADGSLNVTDVWSAVCQVWASLYSERAVLSRKTNRIRGASMAVLIQPLVPATWSFIAHTRCPAGVGNDASAVYVEMARGLGESLASGGAGLGGGKPTQLILNPTGDATVLNLWDLFGRYRAAHTSGRLEKIYSVLRLVETRNEYWQEINRLLAGLKGLERIMGGPQDIEGCIVEDDEGSMNVFILQSRPQQV